MRAIVTLGIRAFETYRSTKKKNTVTNFKNFIPLWNERSLFLIRRLGEQKTRKIKGHKMVRLQFVFADCQKDKNGKG
jgi:hypothetical protein